MAYSLERDVVTLHPAASSDTLAYKLSKIFLPCYHSISKFTSKTNPDPELGHLWQCNAGSFQSAGNVLCAILSFGVPTGSIFALYYVETMTVRLVMVSVFNLVFAFVMMFLVASRRAEVFAATAAFAAVQVVFVGGVNFSQGG